MPRWPERTESERFWEKVNRSGETDCWLWTGGTNRLGYGIFAVVIPTRRWFLAHRYAYEAVVGPIPESLTIDHLCRVHGCVNPAHLEPVTLSENARRAAAHFHANAAKTHCIHGHPFDEENTYVLVREGRTTRSCKKCSRNAERRYRARKASKQEHRPIPA